MKLIFELLIKIQFYNLEDFFYKNIFYSYSDDITLVWKVMIKCYYFKLFRINTDCRLTKNKNKENITYVR